MTSNKIIKYLPLIFYSFISFLILSIYKENYILTLDMVFPLENMFTDFIFGFASPVWSNHIIATSAIKLLSIVLPEWVVQKSILFLLILISGISMHYLVDTESQIPRYFAGILYAINPFVYVRFLAGQWLILLAYSIIPFAVRSLLDLLNKPDKKKITGPLLLTTLVGAFSSHLLVLLFIIYLVLMAYKLYQIRNEMQKGKILLRFFGTFTGVFILLNFFWILPLFSSKATLIDQISQADLYIFATNTLDSNAVFIIASMYGYWREGYIYAKDLIPYWYLLFFFIICLVIYGFIKNYKSKTIGLPVRAFAVVTLIAVILGSGINGPFSSLFDFLYSNIFFFKGLRDSHKFAALLALSYSYLGALGVAEFEKIARGTTGGGYEKYKKFAAWTIVIAALITPFLYSFTMFNGFWGQLKPTDYPADWYEVNDLLNQDGQDFNILFFPWHGYMNFKFVNNTDKRIANPSRNFFDKEVISATTFEIEGIYRQDNAPDQLYIDSLLKNKSNITNFGELVSILNVKYIILAKEVDYKNYRFLLNQSDLELVKETDTLYVLKNKNKVAKIYQTDSIENIGDKEEVIYRTINPVRFEIGETNRKYVIFTEPYSEDWELAGKTPQKAYGAVNAFENSGKEIRFERFYRVNLPAYIISILTLAGLIAIYLGSQWQKKKM